jgi:hypothetical protein
MQEFNYKNTIFDRIGQVEPNVLPNLLPKTHFDIDGMSKVTVDVCAEEILDQLIKSQWAEMDDRFLFLDQLMRAPHMTPMVARVLAEEMKSLDSKGFVNEKKSRFENVVDLVKKIRHRMQAFIDTTLPIAFKSGAPVPEVDIYEHDMEIIAKVCVPGLDMEHFYAIISHDGTCLEVKVHMFF